MFNIFYIHEKKNRLHRFNYIESKMMNIDLIENMINDNKRKNH